MATPLTQLPIKELHALIMQCQLENTPKGMVRTLDWEARKSAQVIMVAMAKGIMALPYEDQRYCLHYISRMIVDEEVDTNSAVSILSPLYKRCSITPADMQAYRISLVTDAAKGETAPRRI